MNAFAYTVIPHALLTLLITVAACSGGDDSPATGGSSITLASATGTRRAADGTWSTCFQDVTNDDGGTWTISGTTLQVANDSFTSNDGSCSGSVSMSQSLTATLSDPTDIAMLDWTDGSSGVAGPTEQDGVGMLADPPIATLITYTVTASAGAGAPTVGTVAQTAWFVDDTASQWRIYKDRRSPLVTGCTPSGNMLTNQCLDTVEVILKQ